MLLQMPVTLPPEGIIILLYYIIIYIIITGHIVVQTAVKPIAKVMKIAKVLTFHSQ